MGSHFLSKEELAKEAKDSLEESTNKKTALGAGDIQAEFLQMGGMVNASTQLFHTSYMLECPESHLSHSMELLSQLLFCPTFDAERIITELDIIEAEYQARCGDSEQQVQAVIQQISHPDHPFHRFCAGNKSTLAKNDPELLCILRRFYQHYYQPKYLSLFVEAPEELLKKIEHQLPQVIQTHYHKALPRHLSAILPCDLTLQLSAPKNASLPLGWPDKNKRLGVKSPNAGYEWCWCIPTLLLPAVDQLDLPNGFSHKIQMIHQEQLILSVSYEAVTVISAKDMQQRLTHLIETLNTQLLQTEQHDGQTSPKKGHEQKQIQKQPQEQKRALPQLLQTVQQSLYHHFRLPVVQASILNNALLRQLNKPVELHIIRHPDISGTAQSDFFPTDYQIDFKLSVNLLEKPKHQVEMPYRSLHKYLMSHSEQLQPEQTDQSQSVNTYDPHNQAALIWLKASPIQDKQQAQHSAHRAIWQLQKYAYQQLRLEQRLGYIVHTGYLELNQQPGIMLLIQGENRFSGEQLLVFLTNFIAQQNNVLQHPIPADKQSHWQAYCKKHQLDYDNNVPLAQSNTDISLWPQIQLFSQTD